MDSSPSKHCPWDIDGHFSYSLRIQLFPAKYSAEGPEGAHAPDAIPTNILTV
jgi:hypothetical protein